MPEIVKLFGLPVASVIFFFWFKERKNWPNDEECNILFNYPMTGGARNLRVRWFEYGITQETFKIYSTPRALVEYIISNK